MSKVMESFGRYILLERLAAGGMAEVFLAKSVGAGGVGKFVAVKRILPQFSDNQEFIDMFKEEAKVVMNLNHSNIVQIYDFGVENGQFFLAMEFVEGQNLRQTLNHMKKVNRDFTVAQICFIVKEVAAGLDHAHRCLDQSTGRPLNLVHRDMSPQNVMVSFEGEVKVVDFGIAKAETQMEATRAGTIKGKFGYMSPEQADGQNVDARTDIFSLGIMLWELLAKDRLFTAQSEAGTLKKIKECQIPDLRKINPAIPPELDRICKKALQRDRAQRYAFADELYKELNRFLNQQYPDFTAREFAKFMKDLYVDMFKENRAKLTEYAKVTHAPKAGVEDRTVVTSTVTVTQTAGGPAMAAPDGDPDHRLDIDPSASRIVDLASLKKDEGKPAFKRPAPGSGNTGTTNTGVSSISTKTGIKSGGIPQGTTTRIRVATPAAKETSWFIPAALVVLVAGGGFWFWQKQRSAPSPTLAAQTETAVNTVSELDPAVQPGPTQDNMGTPAENSAAAMPESGSAESASTAVAPITVSSKPSGAQVFLNGKKVGLTPWRGHVPLNMTYELSIEAEGFLAYKYSETPKKAEIINIQQDLAVEPPRGYLSINVRNGTPSTIVTVDGVRLDKAPPIERYQVIADKEIEVRARDSYTGAEEIKKIRVGANQKMSVELILLSRQSSR